MIPLRAEILRRSAALVTTLLILINTVVFIYQFSLPSRAGNALVASLGLVPLHAQQLLLRPGGNLAGALLPLFTSMFLHGGVLHLLGNMLFLWVFGGGVEDRLGHLRYLLFYLVCGVGAGMVHIATNWGSSVPTIGASGAISGVMGAFIVLFPRSRILTLVPLLFIFFTIRLPALIMLGYWFLIQFLSGLSTFGQINQGGVAWWAHIGGFSLGALLIWQFRQQ
jgi:rhomboid family protein